MEDNMKKIDIIHSYENEIEHFRTRLQFIDSLFYKLMFLVFSAASVISVVYNKKSNFLSKEMILWLLEILVFLFCAFSICLIFNRNVITRYLIELEKKYNHLIKENIKTFDSCINRRMINNPMSKYMFFIYFVILGIIITCYLKFKDIVTKYIYTDYLVILVLFIILVIGVSALIIDNPYRIKKTDA
jgi:hypothetical protein